MNDLQKKVYEAHRQLTEADQQITAEIIRDKFLGKTKKPRLLIEIFIEHNKKMKALIGKGYSQGTLTCFQTSLKHTQDFLKWKYNVTDINIKQVDHSFITEYDFFLRFERKCANNSAVKNMKNFSKIIRICIANNRLNVNPYLNYKHNMKRVDRVYLTTNELQEMGNKQFATNRLSKVRDIFLFCCFTGLAYIDVQKLCRRDIVKGIDGEN